MFRKLFVHFYEENNYVGAGLVYPSEGKSLENAIGEISEAKVKELPKIGVKINQSLYKKFPNADIRIVQIL